MNVAALSLVIHSVSLHIRFTYNAQLAIKSFSYFDIGGTNPFLKFVSNMFLIPEIFFLSLP